MLSGLLVSSSALGELPHMRRDTVLYTEVNILIKYEMYIKYCWTVPELYKVMYMTLITY